MNIVVVEPHKYLLSVVCKHLGQMKQVNMCIPLLKKEDLIPLLARHANNLDAIIYDSSPFKEGSRDFGLITYVQICYPSIKILIYSFFRLGSHIFSMYSRGVPAYLFKERDNLFFELLTALDCIMQGEMYYKGEVREILEEYLLFARRSHLNLRKPKNQLTLAG